jgi:putative two-component system response regulator
MGLQVRIGGRLVFVPIGQVAELAPGGARMTGDIANLKRFERREREVLLRHLLHNIGKIGISDAILLKPGPLTEEEWAVMRKHPIYAYELLAPIDHLRPALDIPYCHHEKWDGTGYPRGLRREEIPLAAHIFAVADVWDALRSDRPYRAGWPEAQVREHNRSLAGSHFDSQVVATFHALRQERLPGQ